MREKKIISFILIFLSIVTSCSMKEKLAGRWLWVSYDYNDSAMKATSKEELKAFHELLAKDFIRNAISNTQIEFTGDGNYSYRFGTSVKEGKYRFESRKRIWVPFGILKSKSEDSYRILKLKDNVLILQNQGFIFELKRKMD